MPFRRRKQIDKNHTIMARIKIGVAKLNASALVMFTNRVILNLIENPHFPDPTPTLEELEMKRSKLAKEEVIAINRVTEAVFNRNQTAEELKDLLRELAHYISLKSKGDPSMILSTGFGIRKKYSTSSAPQSPVIKKIERTSKEGEVLLRWSPIKNAVSFSVEITQGKPQNPDTVWTQVGYTSKSKFTVTQLTRGQDYYFRVQSIGRKSHSGYSPTKTIMAA
jgi:hypothetical protein